MITSYPFVILNRCWSIVSIFVLAVLMSGCSGAPYGITKNEWSALTMPQVQEIHENYQRIKDLRSEEKSWQERSKITASTPKLEITIEEGTVQMPPFVNATTYQPVKLIVYQGHCRSVKLLEKRGKKKTALEACYLGDILYLDPSKTVYQWRHGSLRFYYMPIWQSGFKYSDISSHGYVAFKNATVKIKALVLPEV